MRQNKPLSLLTSLATALFLLSGSIAVPILWRGFYYGQIEALALPARTGWSPQVIRAAYDAVMDYLVKGAPFGTGPLRWSESGKAHFADCRFLFRLDFLILALSGCFLLLVLLLTLTGRVKLHRFLGRSPALWAMAGLLAVVLVLGLWAWTDFTGLFTAFHTLCFPGKTNWIFDWRTDEIILILPEDFWARAAALIAALTLTGGFLLTALDELHHHLTSPKTVYEELRRMK